MLPPLILPMVVSATIHDDDGDGIADRIVATYDSRHRRRLPGSKAGYRWPASAADLVTPTGPSPAARRSLAGRRPGGPVLTTGPGIFLSTYPGRGGKDIIQTFPIQDKIAPVLIKAEMIPGRTAEIPCGSSSASP